MPRGRGRRVRLRNRVAKARARRLVKKLTRHLNRIR